MWLPLRAACGCDASTNSRLRPWGLVPLSFHSHPFQCPLGLLHPRTPLKPKGEASVFQSLTTQGLVAGSATGHVASCSGCAGGRTGHRGRTVLQRRGQGKDISSHTEIHTHTHSLSLTHTHTHTGTHVRGRRASQTGTGKRDRTQAEPRYEWSTPLHPTLTRKSTPSKGRGQTDRHTHHWPQNDMETTRKQQRQHHRCLHINATHTLQTRRRDTTGGIGIPGCADLVGRPKGSVFWCAPPPPRERQGWHDGR